MHRWWGCRAIPALASPTRCRSSTATTPRSACRGSAAPASSPSARCWGRRRCSTASSSAASTRPGLSQKAGPVVSDLRLSRSDVPASNHANSAGVDCLLAFDLLVAASDTHRIGADAERTVVVGSVAVTPTGAMVAHPTTPYPQLDVLTGRLDEVSRARAQPLPRQRARWRRGCSVTPPPPTSCCSVSRCRTGRSPSTAACVERAIELNGVAVARNVAAFRWGRRWAVDPARWPRRPASPPRSPRRRSTSSSSASPPTSPGTSRRATPQRFRDLVAVARSAEQRVDPTQHALHRGRRPQRSQADGLQGRVRGRPVAARRRGARRLRGGRRAGHEGHVAAAPADAAGARDGATR